MDSEEKFMKLTKYEHACFTVEKDGHVLVVDPGNLSSDFISPSGVVGVVITHQHGDHFDLELLSQIIDKNPDALVVGPAEVIDKVETPRSKTVEVGEVLKLGSFKLEFFGGIHALMHESMPRAQNLGIMIDDLIYYPGDALDQPNKPVDVLAFPIGAPWLKLGEAMDFLTAVKPRLAFPTHDGDMIVSDTGKSFLDERLMGWAEKNGIEYERLTNPLEV